MTKKSKLKKIVLIGAGGFGKEVLQTILDCENESKMFDIVGFIDENKKLWGKTICNLKVLGGLEWLENNSNVGCVMCVSDGNIRKTLVKKISELNLSFPSIVHPTALISKFSKIGDGVIIQGFSYIMPHVEIGNHVHVNMSCIIAHDSKIEDFATISTGVHVKGTSVIGEGSFLGSGSVILEEIKIGKWSKIGAGAVMINDAISKQTYVGIPGRSKDSKN